MNHDRRPSVHLIAPALPPKLDGIGDHSARLAVALTAAGADVTVLGPQSVPTDPIDGVRTVAAFDPLVRQSVWDLATIVKRERPDWVVLQYNPFCYGRWGLNLSLPRAFAAMRSGGTRLALFAHEQFVPVLDVKHAIMTSWQRWQFRQLGQAADVVFSSIQMWAQENRRRFPGKPVVHVPVGSNVPRVDISRADARRRLGIEDGAGVLGIFGTAHNSRLTEPVRNALAAAEAAGRRPLMLYMGPDGDAMRAAFTGHRVIAEGPLAADEVSRRLAAVDVYLAGFVDGVSTRRGSWLAALQHGLACVGTVGINTDAVFRTAAAEGACVLVDAADAHGFDGPVLSLLSDPARRETLGAAAAALSNKEIAWDVLAAKVLSGFVRAEARA